MGSPSFIPQGPSEQPRGWLDRLRPHSFSVTSCQRTENCGHLPRQEGQMTCLKVRLLDSIPSSVSYVCMPIVRTRACA